MQIVNNSHSIKSIHGYSSITITCKAKKAVGLAIFSQCPELISQYLVAEPADWNLSNPVRQSIDKKARGLA